MSDRDEDGRVRRKMMVIADETREAPSAALFAGLRAARSGAGVVILRVIERQAFAHWMGVGDEMRREALDAAQMQASSLARLIEDETGLEPEILIEEGDTLDMIRAVITRDATIKVLVLASGNERGGPGPLVSALAKGKFHTSHPLAVTVVPGGLALSAIKDMV
jgi:hypothetical protein